MLHELCEYAQRTGIVTPRGFQSKPIKWLLVFSPEGQFLHVHNFAGDDKRNPGREFNRVPQAPIGWLLGGGKCHFLAESLGTIVEWPNPRDDPDKCRAKHEFFVKLLRDAAQGANIPEFAAIAQSLSDAATLEAIRSQLSEQKAKPNDFATVAVSNSANHLRIFVEETSWHRWWLDFLATIDQPATATEGKRRGGQKTAQLMRDFLTGELVSPCLHDKIRGLSDVGGLSTGDVVAGFDKDAFTSYGLPKGANAAVGQDGMNEYVKALNDLIAKRSKTIARPKQGSGAKVAFWYSGSVPEELDPALDLLGDLGRTTTKAATPKKKRPSTMEVEQAESHAKKALDAIRTGEHPELGNLLFYAITLSANSGRVIIRDWMEGSFEELVNNVNQWFEDLSIIARDGSGVIRSFKFADVLAAPVRELSDVKAPLATALWRSALKRTPIPYEIMAQTLARVEIDVINGNPPRDSRMGLLKAFTVRCERVPSMTAELNDHETHPAYLCGRIMALLGAIQQKALGNVGAGVVQRYYAAASATPALVLGRLIRTAQIAHLPKIDSDALRCWFENQLADLFSRMKGVPPRTLTLEEQTLFALGYYHQLAQRRQKEDLTPQAAEVPDQASLPSTQT